MFTEKELATIWGILPHIITTYSDILPENQLQDLREVLGKVDMLIRQKAFQKDS